MVLWCVVAYIVVVFIVLMSITIAVVAVVVVTVVIGRVDAEIDWPLRSHSSPNPKCPNHSRSTSLISHRRAWLFAARVVTHASRQRIHIM